MSNQQPSDDEFYRGIGRTLDLFMLAFIVLGFLLGFFIGIGIEHPDLNATIELKIKETK